MKRRELLKNCEGFDWDEANELKNWDKHWVKKTEAEQVFFNMPLVVFETYASADSDCYLAIGKTNEGRLLTVIFTIRKKKFIRVISARDMSRKERKVYDESN
jgi:uncharacterized DUF497 family protein